MKNIHFSFFLVILISGLMGIYACSEQKALTIIERDIDFNTLIKEYNATKNPTQHEGVAIEGTIKVSKYTTDKERKIVFQVDGGRLLRKYQFQYNSDQIESDIPELINGKAIYLGDNLIIIDTEKQQYYSFVVENYKNRVSNLTPQQGNGLISVIFDDKNALLQSAASCSCDCQRCLNCQFNCGTSTASCNCGGNSQSATCRDCYNAQCSQCSGGKE